MPSTVEQLRSAKAQWVALVENKDGLSPQSLAIAAALFATLHLEPLFDRAIEAGEAQA